MVDIKTVSARGTTSACAENTSLRFTNLLQKRNYLRVRGEYCKAYQSRLAMWELPPRARRILTLTLKNPLPGGTTSACAENTPLTPAEVATGGNYLRVRGEYIRTQTTKEEYTELPPRARRILAMETMRTDNPGTTSACAENTGYTREIA